ncbi:MAG TPA: kelch repeat-containing protein [Labilithrix sp.]|nr:kelch repeat-containing protein [Labilithrix sp.]
MTMIGSGAGYSRRDPHASVVAAVGSDGEIYTIGGHDGTSLLSLIEAYTP